jgi:uncharacterized protein (DUF58 family)
VLVLSVLIILAMAVAVASFFIASAQWLLLASAALVFLAFYLSRRAPKGFADFDLSAGQRPAVRPREHLTVTIDQDIVGPESGRHRGATEARQTETGPAPTEEGDGERDGSGQHPTNRRAIA